MITKNKILAYILAIILFVVAAMLYLTADSKGFPDGHLTELDRAERPLFYVSSILSLLAGFFLLYLARFNKTANTNRTFYRTLIFLFLVVLIIVSTDWYFIETLDYGLGG